MNNKRLNFIELTGGSPAYTRGESNTFYSAGSVAAASAKNLLLPQSPASGDIVIVAGSILVWNTTAALGGVGACNPVHMDHQLMIWQYNGQMWNVVTTGGPLSSSTSI